MEGERAGVADGVLDKSEWGGGGEYIIYDRRERERERERERRARGEIDTGKR